MPPASAADALPGQKIIVSGASGHLGELTVKDLLARGVPARDLILVSRTPDDLKAYAAQGATVRYGDVQHAESLARAYKGGNEMFFISIGAMGLDRPALHKLAFDAAVKDGVKHIVYTSFVGADTGTSPLALDHRKSEANLKASGATWTMLRNGIYADGQVNQAAQMVADGQATVTPGEGKIAYVTRADCAAVAAAVLTNPRLEQVNSAYDITGPEAIGRRELAQLASEVTGKPIRIVEQAAGAAAAGGSGAGRGPGGAMRGPMAPPTVSDAFEKLTGRPATSVRELLQANRAALLAGPVAQGGRRN